MDIFEYALQMEKDGEDYYHEIADKTGNRGLKDVMNMLADEEKNHFRAIKGMKEKLYSLAQTNIVEDVKNVFVRMRQSGEVFEPGESEVEMFRKAQEIETESRDFYDEKSKEVEDGDQKRLLERLASEEQKHYNMLENIIDFVCKPNRWLENAEWYHLDEY